MTAKVGTSPRTLLQVVRLAAIAPIQWFVQGNRWLSRRTVRCWPGFFRSPTYLDELLRRIQADIAHLRPGCVAELGGADRPMLSRQAGYWFVGVDIEDNPRCLTAYDQFVVMSVEDPVPVPIDMAVSTTLLEHVHDNNRAIGSIAEKLRPGGRTHHYVPSKWHPYSIALRLIGPALQKKLIAGLRPEAAKVTGYPAFFDQCSPRQMETLFRNHGFIDIDIRPFFGAAGYFDFFFPAFVAVRVYERLCEILQIRSLCSGFIISATKPQLAGGAESVNPGEGDPATMPAL